MFSSSQHPNGISSIFPYNFINTGLIQTSAIIIDNPYYSHMIIQQKKDQIYKRIRREQREKLFEKIRLEMLSSVQEQGNGRAQNNTMHDGQQQILESIQHYRNENQPLNFVAINQYIYQYNGKFSEELKEELLTLVLQKFNKNPHALACVANMLSKCEDYQVSSSQNLRQFLQNLLSSNSDMNAGTMANSRIITFLLFELLRLANDKQVFTEIRPYYPLIVKVNGYLDSVVLFLLSQASSHRSLLPQKEIIQAYLRLEISYETLSEAMVYKLCELLDNNLRYQQTTTLFQLYSDWIERRLIEKAFPIKLKSDLIRLMVVILNSLDASSAFIEYLTKLSVIKEILYYARFGNNDCKTAALELIYTLIKISDDKLINFYVEEYLLIEVLVYSLELALDQDLVYKLLISIGLIFNANSRFIRKAYQLGLRKNLMKFEDCKYQKNILEAVFMLEEAMSEL